MCKSLSNIIIEYDVAIIKCNNKNILSDRDEWYNRGMEYVTYDDYDNSYIEKYLLPPLDSIPNIEITKKFNEIKIVKTEDRRIKLKDILFATKGLCYNQDCIIEDYKIISNLNRELVLEVSIDNNE